MKGTTELKTERLVLRRYRPEDAEILYKNFGQDPEMFKYSGWNPYASKEMAEGTVRQFMENYADPSFYGWAIEREGKMIGTVGAYDYDAKQSRIEIGMSIERASWGKGYAGETLTRVLKYLSEDEKIGTITAWCASDNIGSRKAMEKAGMKQTGTEEGALEIDGKTYDKLNYEYKTGQ